MFTEPGRWLPHHRFGAVEAQRRLALCCLLGRLGRACAAHRSARHLVPHLHSSRVVQAPFNILNYLIMEQLTATFLGRTM